MILIDEATVYRLLSYLSDGVLVDLFVDMFCYSPMFDETASREMEDVSLMFDVAWKVLCECNPDNEVVDMIREALPEDYWERFFEYIGYETERN